MYSSSRCYVNLTSFLNLQIECIKRIYVQGECLSISTFLIIHVSLKILVCSSSVKYNLFMHGMKSTEYCILMYPAFIGFT